MWLRFTVRATQKPRSRLQQLCRQVHQSSKEEMIAAERSPFSLLLVVLVI